MRIVYVSILMKLFLACGGVSRVGSFRILSRSAPFTTSHYAQRAEKIAEDDPIDSYDAGAISWYPGHIAKAERELGEYLKKVDVVIEVRDARIPLATTHPMVPEWIGNRPLVSHVNMMW